MNLFCISLSLHYLCSMSYTDFIYHIVLRTYRSTTSIIEDHEKELYAYILGFCNNHKAKLYRIGGMPDHEHLLMSIPPTIAVSVFIRKLKFATNGWLKRNPSFPQFNGWGKGYAAFTYSKEQLPIVRNYIMNQKEHHRAEPFEQEYRQFILDHGVEIDERYFLED